MVSKLLTEMASYMPMGSSKEGSPGHPQSLGANRRYAWKERAYPVPTASRKQFRWKASALRSLNRLNSPLPSQQPVTVVVPALYNFFPAEGIALGWLNDVDAHLSIRHKITATAKLTGWDVFTFHTLHNLDSYYDSSIVALRDTWLREGSLDRKSVVETLRQFGKAYDYHRLHARLVENLVFQSSLMEWLTTHAAGVPLRFHVVGTALVSALVWSGSLPFEAAVHMAERIGSYWDDSITRLAESDLKQNAGNRTEEDLGWMRFYRIRQILEGGTHLALAAGGDSTVHVEAPRQPFWFSATSQDEPLFIETAQDIQVALGAMNLASWSPASPRLLANDRIRGWLVSALHPMSSACRWSVYNYLLATPSAGLAFLRHIAGLGRVTMPAEPTNEGRFGLSKIKEYWSLPKMEKGN